MNHSAIRTESKLHSAKSACGFSIIILTTTKIESSRGSFQINLLNDLWHCSGNADIKMGGNQA